jgi:hypothetical protein
MRWTGEPREFLIDLRGIATRDQFHDELACHFTIPADNRELWGGLFNAIALQTGPYRLHLMGWAEFEGRMPRYARRLRRFIENYQGVHGEERLAADYA